MSIKIQVESQGAINFLTTIDAQLEESIEDIIEQTVREVEQKAIETIEGEYTFDTSKWPLYYHGIEEINGTEGSVTIPHDFVPINAFDYENQGLAGNERTIRHDPVWYQIHRNADRYFKSNFFLHNYNAFYRTTNSSTPYYSYFLPDIPQMLWEEKDSFIDKIEEAFNQHIQEALGAF